MACFHFSFDLNYFGFIHARTSTRDPFWTVQRACIVSLFLLGAGAGQAVASTQGQTLARFWRRWAQIAGCAVLVSLGSWLMFPHSWISFGVLHGIAVMLIVRPLGTGCVGASRARWPLGARSRSCCRGWCADPFFDTPLDQLGRPGHAPAGDRGLRAGAALARRRCWWGTAAAACCWRIARGALTGAVPRAARPLAVLGRWTLSFYMVHQPVLIGSLAGR